MKSTQKHKRKGYGNRPYKHHNTWNRAETKPKAVKKLSWWRRLMNYLWRKGK
jgi:hypothetical protein